MTVASPIATLLAALPVPPPAAPPTLDAPAAFLDLLSELDVPEMPAEVEDAGPAPHTPERPDDDNLLAAAWAVLPPAPVAVLDPEPITCAMPEVTLTPDAAESAPALPPSFTPAPVALPESPVELPTEGRVESEPDPTVPMEALEQRTDTRPAPKHEAMPERPELPPPAAAKQDPDRRVQTRAVEMPTAPEPAPTPTPVPLSIAPPDETLQAEPVPETKPERPIRTRPQAPLAFAARLRPLPPPVAERPKPQPAPEKPAPKPEAPETHAAPRDTKRAPADPPRATQTDQPSSAVERPSADRRIDFGAAPRTEDAPAADSEEQPAAAAAPPPKVAPRREAPLAPPVARDIRLEVASPDRKVEVRLVERSGEVHFAVRTPDSRLAEGLRSDLPQLSARLEEAGFRAEEWRVASASGGERRLDVGGAASSSADTRQHGHSGDGGSGQERRDQQPAPRHPDTPRRRSQKGSEFEWLMQSLR